MLLLGIWAITKQRDIGLSMPQNGCAGVTVRLRFGKTSVVIAQALDNQKQRT